MNAAPESTTVALTLVTVGLRTPRTVKEKVDVAEPPGAVTFTVPVVAPAGTVTSSSVKVAAVTVAATPLNVTAFWLSVEL